MRHYSLLFTVVVLLFTTACNENAKTSSSQNNAQNGAKDNVSKADVDVPAAIRSDFEQRYPAANDIEWEKDEDKYKVDFRINGEKNTLKYDQNNQLVKSEIRIDKSALPATVTKAIESQYAGYSIEKADEINEAGKGKEYEVEVKKGEEVVDLHYTTDGKLVKKDPEKKKKN